MGALLLELVLLKLGKIKVICTKTAEVVAQVVPGIRLVLWVILVVYRHLHQVVHNSVSAGMEIVIMLQVEAVVVMCDAGWWKLRPRHEDVQYGVPLDSVCGLHWVLAIVGHSGRHRAVAFARAASPVCSTRRRRRAAG